MCVSVDVCLFVCVCVCVCVFVCGAGGDGVGEEENGKTNHMNCRLIRQPGIIEPANAIQRQCNPRCQKAIICG